MKQFNRNFFIGIAVAVGVAYPFFVYFFMDYIPCWMFLVIALCAAVLRFISFKENYDFGLICKIAFAVIVALGLLYLKSDKGAVLAYPVIVSLVFAAYFGISLIYPPCVVERIARIREPELSQEGVRYTRRVTWVWFVFLVINACVSLASAVWGTMDQWMLWNGLISYLAMGIVFVGEFFVRKIVRS